MEHATLSRETMKRDQIIDRLGGIEVPWGQVNALRWEDIPKDCLPVILYKSATPKAVVCANRMQLDSLKKVDHEYVKECFIVEISRLMKHSNLTYCEETIEKDRKFKHKRKKLLSNTKKLMMKDIVQNLNRSRTAAEIAATYDTSTFNINHFAAKLRKPPYNFNIPGARGFDDFSVFADEIAKENPELVKRPLAHLAKKTNLLSRTEVSSISKNGHHI